MATGLLIVCTGAPRPVVTAAMLGAEPHQNPLLIISGKNQSEAIIKHDTVKIRIFFQFEILLNFIVIQ